MKSQIILKTKIAIPYSKSEKNQGFTLLEVIITIAIIVILGCWSLFYGLDNLKYHSFDSDREILISTLQYARGKAMANTCDTPCSSGQPYGVYIGDDKFIIFQGQNYFSAFHDSDVSLTHNPDLIHSGINEIYFDQISGNAHSNQPLPWKIILASTLTNKKSTITINNEGQISWTN